MTFTASENEAICNEINRQVAEIESQGALVCSQVYDQIRRRVCAAAARVKQAQATGLGQGATDLVAQAKEAISPWLWVFSVIGFGLALVNTRRISEIYGGYRAGKRALRRGEAPAI